MRVLLRGLPKSRSIPAEAYTKAKLMRRCMLFAVTLILGFAIVVMQAYEFVIFIAFVSTIIRWLVGDWKEAANTLKATSS